MLTQDQVEAIAKGAQYASLKEDPTFKALIEEARLELVKSWNQLLIAPLAEVERLRGFIAGGNMLLDLVDEHVHEAALAMDQQLREKEAVLAQSRIAAGFQQERVNRRVRLGADLGH